MLLTIILQADTYLGELIKQGPLMGALGIAVYYFYNKTNKLEDKISENAKKMEDYYKEDRNKMIDVINNSIKSNMETTVYREQKSKEIMDKLDDLLDAKHKLIEALNVDRETKTKMIHDIDIKINEINNKLNR